MYKTNTTKALVIAAVLFTSIGVNNYAQAITVIDKNLPSATEDWGSSTSMNSLNNIGALTCSGLDQSTLEHCQSATDFDLTLSVIENSDDISNQNDLENEEESDDSSSSNSSNSSNSEPTSIDQIITPVVLNDMATHVVESIEETTPVESLKLPSVLPETKEVQKDDTKNVPTEATSIIEKNTEKVVKKSYVAKKKSRDVKNYVVTINLENNSVDSLKDYLAQFNKEISIASADVFKDWTQINDTIYQADPTLIYVWFGLASFQSLFIAIYLAKNKFSFEKSGERK